MNPILHSLQTNAWIVEMFFIILCTAILHFICTKVLSSLHHKAENTRIIYDEALIYAVQPSLSLIIWLSGLSIAISGTLASHVHINLVDYIPQAKRLGYIFAISWGLIRFIRQIEALYILRCEQDQKEVDKTLVHALGQLLTISVIITSILAAMQLLGLPISGLLAFGGIGGAGIAFASKDLLANFFGGLVVYTDRPFKVGDWIRSPDKNIEGVVEYIGWRVTRIRTFDKRPLYVPNGIFLTISVENPSRMTNRRIRTMIGLRYEDADKMDSITHDVKQMLLHHPEIDTRQIIIVNFAEYGPSSLNFLVYTFTKTTQWLHFQEIQHDVFLKILSIIRQNGAKCAFPTQTIHLQNSMAMQSSIEESPT